MRRGITSESHSEGRKLSGIRSSPPAPGFGMVTFFFFELEAGELLASPSSPSLAAAEDVEAPEAAAVAAPVAATAAAAEDEAAAYFKPIARLILFQQRIDRNNTSSSLDRHCGLR